MHISFDCQDWFLVGGAPGEDVSGSRTQTSVYRRAENTPGSSLPRERAHENIAEVQKTWDAKAARPDSVGGIKA